MGRGDIVRRKEGYGGMLGDGSACFESARVAGMSCGTAERGVEPGLPARWVLT